MSQTKELLCRPLSPLSFAQDEAKQHSSITYMVVSCLGMTPFPVWSET